MTETPRPTPATPAVPTPGDGPTLAAPVDLVAQAETRITAAVDALEATRSAGLDEQLAAAEEVHAVLAEHLNGRP